MRNKILLSIALLIMLFDFSSCVMHYEHGTPYKVWRVPRNTRHHWGSQRYGNSTHRYWSKHRYGRRPHPYRGNFRF